MKFPWWRGSGVRGFLYISGYEVTTGALISAQTAGYGLTDFNASTIYFPAEGCFRVNAESDGARLSFVVLVRKCPAPADIARSQRTTYALCIG